MEVKLHIINLVVVLVELGIDSILECIGDATCKMVVSNRSLQDMTKTQTKRSSFASNNSKTESQQLPLLRIYDYHLVVLAAFASNILVGGF